MIGEALAISAAFCWAVAVILFKRSEQVGAHALNLFKNVFSMALLVPTMLVLGVAVDRGRSVEDWVSLIISGVLGIAIADTFFFAGLRRLGPSLLAVVECAYAPLVVIAAMIVLAEMPTVGLVLGAALVVGGVLYVTSEKGNLPELDRKGRSLGVLYSLAGVVAMVIGVVLAKPALERSHLVEATMIRLAAGLMVQVLLYSVVPSLRSTFRVLRPSRVWRTLVPASFFGSYVAMLLWLGGYKWANASTAAILNQMTTVFIIGLDRVILGEPITRRRALGAAVAVTGAVVVLSI